MNSDDTNRNNCKTDDDQERLTETEPAISTLTISKITNQPSGSKSDIPQAAQHYAMTAAAAPGPHRRTRIRNLLLRNVPYINLTQPYPSWHSSTMTIVPGIPDNAEITEATLDQNNITQCAVSLNAVPPSAPDEDTVDEPYRPRQSVFHSNQPPKQLTPAAEREGRRATLQELRLLRSEAVRLRTFLTVNWRRRFSPELLAQNGLYFYNNPRAVQCAFCLLDIGIHDLPNEEDILATHRDSRTCCPYLQGLEVGNIPLDSDDLQPRQAILSTVPFKTELSTQELYSTPEFRLESFKNWPKLAQNPEEMASAGFYYTGLGDQVKCFTCHQTFKMWYPSDKPLLRHALEAPGCSYLFPFMHDEMFQNRLETYEKMKKQEARVREQRKDEIDLACAATAENQLKCRICYCNEINTLLLPCCHVTCASCTTELNNCPMCRRPFNSYARILVEDVIKKF